MDNLSRIRQSISKLATGDAELSDLDEALDGIDELQESPNAPPHDKKIAANLRALVFRGIRDHAAQLGRHGNPTEADIVAAIEKLRTVCERADLAAAERKDCVEAATSLQTLLKRLGWGK